MTKMVDHDSFWILEHATSYNILLVDLKVFAFFFILYSHSHNFAPKFFDLK